MKSPHTGKPMRLQFQKGHLHFKGEYIRHTHISYLCQDTGETYTDATLDELNLYQIYYAYSQIHNIPIEQVMPKEDNNTKP